MGLWQLLFPPRPPLYPPENAETQALWDRARQLASTNRLSLYPSEWASITTENFCLQYGVDPFSDFAWALTELAEELVKASGLYDFPPDAVLDYALADMGEGIRLRELLRDKIVLLKHAEANEAIVKAVVEQCLESVLSAINYPPSARGGDKGSGRSSRAFCVPLLSCIPDMGALIERLVGRLFGRDVLDAKLFNNLTDSMCELLDTVFPQRIGSPSDYLKQKGLSNEEAIKTFLRGTPFVSVFLSALPFAIPEAVRFEHMYILAGSGHGKTQTLQHIILDDIERAKTEKFGFALIDSQGDLIDKITKLAVFDPDEGELAGRLVIIDPNDLQHPAGLNLFDHNLSRFEQFSELEREKIFHGVLELYSYIFSALLGAELTQKQGVVFTNLARVLMVMPEPTIYTFYDFVENGADFRQYIEQLDGIPRRFFETQLFTKNYDQTRQQIITRLLGVLGNPAFERMFAHPKNNIDMFGAMQRGDIVLVNTAKDLLKSEGSSILGRFFIALISQATLARASIPERERVPYHLYVDEAQEYFDVKTDELLNQGRKFKVGVTLAHQNLNQLSSDLKSTIKSSTSIKLAGGVNHADAVALAQEMNCSAEYIQSMRKSEKHGYTEFACYIRHHTEQPVRLSVPFGSMERLERMSAPAYRQLIDDNRARVAKKPELPAPSDGEGAGDHEQGGNNTAGAGYDPNANPKPSPKVEPPPKTKPTRKPADDLGFTIKVDPPQDKPPSNSNGDDDFYV